MMCTKPWFHVEHGTLPCGQCLNCRVNRRRMWTARILLESAFHVRKSFITLTYDDKHVPRSPESGLQILRKQDLQLFWKRLRKQGHQLRYYACGEYGRKTWRPHYHAIVFGMGEDQVGDMEKAWYEDDEPIGFVSASEVNQERAAYCAGYTVEKMTSSDDERLKGRTPEFGVMSRNPGIGTQAVPHLAAAADKMLAKMQGREDEIERLTTVRLQGRVMPLGRTLTAKLTEAATHPLPAPKATLPELEEVMHARSRAAKLERRRRQRIDPL